MILDHTGDIQRLKRDRAVQVDQFTAQFVLKVFALIGDPFVQDGNRQAGMIPVLGTFSFATQAPLANLQASLTTIQVLGLPAFVAIAQGSKDGQAQVDTNRRNLWCWVFDFNLALDANEVAPALGFRAEAGEDARAPLKCGRGRPRPLRDISRRGGEFPIIAGNGEEDDESGAPQDL